MNPDNLASLVQGYNKKTEDIFMSLSSDFPKLLNGNQGSSCDDLKNIFNKLENESNLSRKTEIEYFGNYSEKYSSLFEGLNEKIESLSNINEQINNIKNDSEEMELIALNAMVVSIKSGEKGRAFSCITENLQRLSSDMISLSGKLTNEETALIQNINALKNLFQDIIDCQNRISQISFSQMNKIKQCMDTSSAPLQEFVDLSNSVFPLIQSSMEGLNLQENIKELFNKACKNLKEIVQDDFSSSDEKMIESTNSIIQDISTNLNESIKIFMDNWDKVKTIFAETDEKRKMFIENCFNSNYSEENFSVTNLFEAINDDFQQLNNEFTKFQNAQKRVVGVCRGITDKARGMYDIFINLRPVINRLQHVRILQEIEVSKNEAIKTVKDFVTDMDNLIADSSNSLDIMQSTIEVFIQEIGELINSFSVSIADDTLKMNEVKSEKTNFFTHLQELEDKFSSITQNFTAYSPEFSYQCNNVIDLLDQLNQIESDLKNISLDISTENKKVSSYEGYKEVDNQVQESFDNVSIDSNFIMEDVSFF